MKIGFKQQIYPTESQIIVLKEILKHSHNMWNFLVQKYNEIGYPKVNKFGIIGYSTTDLINEYGVVIPQRVVLGVIKTYSDAVKEYKKGNRNKPKFHKYDPNKQSFYFSSRTANIYNKKGEKYILIRSLGISNAKLYLNYNTDISYITEPRISFRNNKWYISGSYNIDDIPKRKGLDTIGLDWGIKNFMTTSTGEFINYPKTVIREYKRIKRLQSIKDKKVKGSKNQLKVKSKLSKAYERFENLKRDFIEKETTKLCKDQNIVIEDIKVQSIKRKGKFIRQNIVTAPLYRFVKKLEWKCEKFGTTFTKVNPAYTSKTCSKCGLIKEDLTLKDRVFECECGYINDRDVNAAINIAARGICCTY